MCSIVRDLFIFYISVNVLLFVDLIYFDVIYPYTSELFETKIRGTGFAYVSSYARFAGFVSPFILLEMHNVDTYFPYYAMSVVSLLTLINCFFFKYDTRGIKLDTLH